MTLWTPRPSTFYPDCVFSQETRPFRRRPDRPGPARRARWSRRAARAQPDAAAGGVRRPGGARLGARELLRRLGLRRPRPTTWRGPAASGASPLGGRGVLLIRGRGRRAARLRQRLPAPRARAAAVRGADEQEGDRLPLPRVVLPARRLAARGARLPRRRPASTPTGFGLIELPVGDWHGWVFVDPSGDGRRLRRARRRRSRTIVAPYAPEKLRGRSPPTSTRSRPTGRSSSRTTRSATTAR